VHARDYAAQAQRNPDTQITAVWDEDDARGRQVASGLDADLAPSLEALLARSDVDGVIVTTATTCHRDVIMAAASAGKHVFTEKLLAPTVRECADILEAVQGARVRLMVSLPHTTYGYALALREVVSEGRLGRLTVARVRRTHNGVGWLPERFFRLDEAAGGALFDLGCHPMYLVRQFLGLPEAVTATYGHVTGRAAEDNAVALLHYASGAIGVVESGFVEDDAYSGVELHGMVGSAVLTSADGRLLVRSQTAPDPRAWVERPVGQHGPAPFDQWVEHIRRGTAAVDNVQLALDLTLLMEACDRSARTGRRVPLADIEG